MHMFFRQIKHRGDNFSYIIADDIAKEAAVVDPSFNTDAITKILKEQNLQLKLIINTHGHADHTAGNQELQKSFNAKIAAHRQSKINKQISVEDGDTLKIGEITIKVIHTPGHTPDSICLLVNDNCTPSRKRCTNPFAITWRHLRHHRVMRKWSHF